MMIWGRHKKTEELINVLNVERGIKCDCICPSCGATLVAHKANIAHHFKHFRAIECKGASESAMHLKAKEIISKYRIINLPALTAHLEQDGIYKSVRVIPESLLRLDDKILKEERVGKKIPDLIVSYKTRKILIEIAVTHFVDSEKKLDTRNRGISCVEIDLSDLYKRQGSITDNELIDYVIYRTDNKKWIHNTKFSRSKKRPKS